MRLSMGHVDSYDEQVGAFARQLGLTGVQLHNPDNLSAPDGYWPVDQLRSIVERCAADGLRIDGLENVSPANFFKIQRGLPGRDEQIENFCTTIRNMGEVGLDTLGYNFLVTYVWRTEMQTAGRGGAVVTRFDLADALRNGNALAGYKLVPADVEQVLDEDTLWANHQYFLDAVLPVAERSGVRLALHPDDPPVAEPLGDAARIFRSPAALERAYEQAGGSPWWGLNFCIGTVSEMGGQAAVLDVIERLGTKQAICYVHLRDVAGTVPSFSETFLGDGNLDVAAVLRRLHEVGFDGFIIDDHVPAMIGDLDTWGDTSPAAYCSRGRAHAIGYLQGVLNGLGLA